MVTMMENLLNTLDCQGQDFSAKINETGGAEFNQGEISKIKQRYNLTADEIDSIFI